MRTDDFFGDLACERRRADLTVPGVSLRKETFRSMQRETLRISSREGAATLGRPEGTYVTLTHPPPWDFSPEDKEQLTDLVEEALLAFAPPKTRRILVAGLGNRALTADAIGCATAEKVNATRHISLYQPELFRGLSCREICVITPGVLAQSGMESVDFLQSTAGLVHPDLLIVIDALAARSCERLARTIQLSDAGIVPGSGIGNHRKAISAAELHIPVIALGIPTVVDAASVTREILEAGNVLDLPPSLEQALTERGHFFVSPKECDLAVSALSGILSAGINRAFGISYD